jgi:hypothetical protein
MHAEQKLWFKIAIAIGALLALAITIIVAMNNGR